MSKDEKFIEKERERDRAFGKDMKIITILCAYRKCFHIHSSSMCIKLLKYRRLQPKGNKLDALDFNSIAVHFAYLGKEELIIF